MLDKIKQIKYSRLKEEERFFLDTIDGIQPFTTDKYPDSIFWMKNDKILLEQDYQNGWLRVNYNMIWIVFINKYDYDYVNTQSFIKNMIMKYIDSVSFTSIDLTIRNDSEIYKHIDIVSLMIIEDLKI